MTSTWQAHTTPFSDRVSGDPSLPWDCRQSEHHPNLSDWTKLRVGSETFWITEHQHHQPKGSKGDTWGREWLRWRDTRSHKKWQYVERWARSTAFSSVPVRWSSLGWLIMKHTRHGCLGRFSLKGDSACKSMGKKCIKSERTKGVRYNFSFCSISFHFPRA